ncbi:hypothetical protein T281_13790 [Rhodomicrobium udaipurense JA643]|uniref:Peptidase U35 n=1 Tax=Rhodomicrobium udaipurense TaxID=1202716 RepID=A0A8I1GCE2_9HYPH|nr:hypothetical protein [Rhodomicrobium udaipurense]KAI93932.1 hypothetical protein T281_13790 [Rhodomicrobium udaipurense JA643]MBJ7543255.1 hypothetical protein [Rhodomicrobium udaipurense]
MPKIETRRDAHLPGHTRALPISSVDKEARTVDVVFSTGAKVQRWRWVGWDVHQAYEETLVISNAAINMERLQAGGPVLDSHNSWSTQTQVAVVDRAWVEGDKALARIRFPSPGVDELSDNIWGKVSEGIVRNVSVGYSQDQIRVVEAEKKGDIEQWIVERWTPFEISFVPVPADPGAQVRGARSDGGERSFPAVITLTKETKPMSDPVREAPEVPAQEDTTRANPQPAAAVDAKALLAAERKRIADISTLARQHGMSEDFIRTHTEAGTSVTEVGAKILDALAARAKETDTATIAVDKAADVRGGSDKADHLRAVQRSRGVKLRSDSKAA